MSKPVGPYTPAIEAGGLLFVSGQIGQVDGVVVDGFGNQVRQALDNLTKVLKDNGATLAQVVKVNIFVTDMSNYAEMNEIYLAAFDGHKPARSAVGVAQLPLGAEFEIEAVANAS